MNSSNRLEIIQTNANCRGAAEGTFFPKIESKGKATAVNNKYCGECPVKELCFAHAYEVELEGIWAGTTKAQRKKMRKDEFALRESYDYMRRHTWADQLGRVSVEELVKSESAKHVIDEDEADEYDEEQIA